MQHMPPGQIVRTPHDHLVTEARAVKEDPPSPVDHRGRPKPHPDDQFAVCIHRQGDRGWVHYRYCKAEGDADQLVRELESDGYRVRKRRIVKPELPPESTPPQVAPDPAIVALQDELRNLWEQLGSTRAVPNDPELLRREIAAAKAEIERRRLG